MESFIFIHVFQLEIPGDSSCEHSVHIYYGIECITAGGKLGLHVFLIFAVVKNCHISFTSFLLNSHLHCDWEGCG